MAIYIKATMGELEHHNVGFVLQMIMRDLNKTNFYGYEKKEIAIFIMTVLLEAFGVPEIIAYYTASALEAMVEVVYKNRMHRFKKPSGCSKCLIV